MKNIIKEPEVVGEVAKETVVVIKGYIFDIIGVLAVAALAFVSLGALQLIPLTWASFGVLLVSFIPLFLTKMILTTNYYLKGTFKGKTTSGYVATLKAYNNIVNAIDGKELAVLDDFCIDFNNNALVIAQTNLLKTVSIPYEHFDKEFINSDNIVVPSLRSIPKKQLSKMYGKEITTVIQKAKHMSVKGISSNNLLGSTTSNDPTNIGANETELQRSDIISTAISSVLSTFLLSIIGVKDISSWGWMGCALVMFKMVYIFVGSYMKYFSGFNDISVKLVNHIARKTDILKEFRFWYQNSQNNLLEKMPENLEEK